MKPSDHNILQVVQDQQQTWGGAHLWDVQAHFSMFHKREIWRALQSLIKRGKLVGCGCGCRGDFKLPT